MKLSLYYPASPYRVTQAFGLTNPFYNQWGFTKHNGVDFAVDTDGIVRAMCDGVVYETGYNSGAGNFVRYKTNLPVEAEGKTALVAFMYMHAKEVLVKSGQTIHAGDALIVADNTGSSTGPHTHISAYFINELWQKIPLNPETDHCFDFSKYYNGQYADDIILALQRQVLSLMSKILAYIKR